MIYIGDKVVVTPWGLNIRENPTTKSKKMGKYSKGETAKVIDLYDGDPYFWLKTDRGWIASDFVAKIHPFSWMAWPTEYLFYPGSSNLKVAINQHFGENPDIYERYNLPGHEGIDFYTQMGSKIFAIADGVVTGIGDDIKSKSEGGHNYGTRVYIKHGEHTSIYAHLSARTVSINDKVSAGQIIGYGGSTGNSTGVHLHLTLKREGGINGWPYDIVNPTNYIRDFLIAVTMRG